MSLDKNCKKPLDGVVVLAAEQFEAMPICTQMLSDFGATIIKLERPGPGDTTRKMGPIVVNEYGDKIGGFFFRFNKNKKGIAIDLKSPEGIRIFKELAAKSDIVVSNFKPGTMEKMGLGYEDLKAVKEDIIYATISGFGFKDSPYSDRPAFDLLGQALSGLMYCTATKDNEPQWMGIPITDQITGYFTCMAIIAAVLFRERTGKGQWVDMALIDSTIALVERWINIYDVTGVIPDRIAALSSSPYGPYSCKDGAIAISGGQTPVWPRFCKVIGREDLIDDERFNSMQKRAAEYYTLKDITEEWLKDKTCEEAIQLFVDGDVPVSNVLNVAQMMENEHVKAHKLIQEYDSPYSGKRRIAGSPFRFSEFTIDDPVAPPELGQHTAEILKTYLGYDDEKLAALENDGVIFCKK